MSSFFTACKVGLLMLELAGIFVIGVAAQLHNSVLGIIGGTLVVVSIVIMGMVYRLENVALQNRQG